MSPERGPSDPTPEPEPHSEPHDEGGLELARSVARALARVPGAVRRGRGPRGGPRDRRPAAASGAHPDDRDPQLLDATLGRLVADQGWSTDVRVHGVIGRWGSLVGAEIAAHATPESFADGRLSVRTDSTAWATQLRLLAPTLLARLNAELGDGTVTFIEVRGPAAPSWRSGPRRVRGGRGPRDTYG